MKLCIALRYIKHDHLPKMRRLKIYDPTILEQNLIPYMPPLEWILYLILMLNYLNSTLY